MTSARIRSAIAATDFLRRTTASYAGGGQKEWLHFGLHSSSVSALVNFSVSDGLKRHGRSAGPVGRVVCIVRDSEWDGDVDSYGADSMSIRGGRIDLRLGDCSVTFDGVAFHLDVSLARRSLSMNLKFEPEALPSESNNVFFDDCPPMSWVVVPRLRATGFIRIGARQHALRGAPAYHDHNWGAFKWGKNFTWEWGYVVPEATSEPWSMVFVRFMDRDRLADLMRGVLVWRGERQARIFRGDEVSFRYEGLLRQPETFKLPRAMALAAPSGASDVPKRLIVRAAARGDVIEAVFDADRYAQLIAPNDDDLGMTAINEAFGRATCGGVIGSETVRVSAPSTFEFLHG
jgi:hypothetical protein